MEKFLDENEGLKSRIPFTIEFPAYTPVEVAEIVLRSLNKDWSFDEAFLLQASALSMPILVLINKQMVDGHVTPFKTVGKS